jgi:flagellar FliL protein
LKKIIIIIVAVLVVAAAVLFLFVFKGEPKPEYDQYSPGEYFVTNVKDSNRLLKTSIVLELDSEKLQEELTEKNTLIRDTIIYILRDMDEQEIMSDQAQDILRNEIRIALNSKLETEHIIGVLFNDFVMQ